jgi:hypothetical protein
MWRHKYAFRRNDYSHVLPLTGYALGIGKYKIKDNNIIKNKIIYKQKTTKTKLPPNKESIILTLKNI